MRTSMKVAAWTRLEKSLNEWSLGVGARASRENEAQQWTFLVVSRDLGLESVVITKSHHHEDLFPNESSLAFTTRNY